VSNINYAIINENFPVAGQDNDTQTFRDNFDAIKTALRYAQEEINDLQDNTSRTDSDNNFNDKVITGAVFQNNKDALHDAGVLAVPTTVDYENGNYQIFRFQADVTISFLNFPSDLEIPYGVGKVVLEIYGDGSERTITLDPSGGVTYRKKGLASTSFTVQSTTTPTIIEVWRYSLGTIFVNYLGLFE
jgi:hypothetical protein